MKDKYERHVFKVKDGNLILFIEDGVPKLTYESHKDISIQMICENALKILTTDNRMGKGGK